MRKSISIIIYCSNFDSDYSIDSILICYYKFIWENLFTYLNRFLNKHRTPSKQKSLYVKFNNFLLYGKNHAHQQCKMIRLKLFVYKHYGPKLLEMAQNQDRICVGKFFFTTGLGLSFVDDGKEHIQASRKYVFLLLYEYIKYMKQQLT